MSKRSFRPRPAVTVPGPKYPTLRQFVVDQRLVLGGLGIALASSGAVTGCISQGEPAIPEITQPADAGNDIAGGAPAPDSGFPDAAKKPPDAGPVAVDAGEVIGGAAPAPDSGIPEALDAGAAPVDAGEQVDGDPAIPDSGYPEPVDAGVASEDGGDPPLGGGAPAPDSGQP